jgi:hypothetical protein
MVLSSALAAVAAAHLTGVVAAAAAARVVAVSALAPAPLLPDAHVAIRCHAVVSIAAFGIDLHGGACFSIVVSQLFPRTCLALLISDKKGRYLDNGRGRRP